MLIVSKHETSHEQILESIDRGLAAFGEDVRQEVYYLLRIDCNLRRTEIISKPEVFTHFLYDLFGPGYSIVESVILHQFHESFGISHSVGLEQAIRIANQRLL